MNHIIDIFTDASIDINTKLACAGMIVINRSNQAVLDYHFYLDPNSTNNRAEIMAVERAVAYAVELYYHADQPFEVNIISDSMFAIEGVREWMLNWTATCDYVLLNSSGNEAANQSFFKSIFSMIVFSGMKIRFYHQKGHVRISPNGLFQSEHIFYRTNGISVEKAGLAPKYLAEFNNEVDQRSRTIIQKVQNGSINVDTVSGISYYMEAPMEFYRNSALIELYKSLIKGGVNYPVQNQGGKQHEN